jgi:hypothetical protein
MAIPRGVVLLAVTALVAVALMVSSAVPAFAATPPQYVCIDPDTVEVVFVGSKKQAKEFAGEDFETNCTRL